MVVSNSVYFSLDLFLNLLLKVSSNLKGTIVLFVEMQLEHRIGTWLENRKCRAQCTLVTSFLFVHNTWWSTAPLIRVLCLGHSDLLTYFIILPFIFLLPVSGDSFEVSITHDAICCVWSFQTKAGRNIYLWSNLKP